jgi:hypothetical protein
MPAEVTLTVTSFVENNSATPSHAAVANCAILPQFQMDGDATGAWKRDREGQVFLCPAPDVGTLAFKRKPDNSGPIPITFRIAVSGGVPPLSPTKIVFEQQAFRDQSGRAKLDPDGTVNFPVAERSAAGDSLTVRNHWIHHGPSRDRSRHAAPIWKFWIRVTTADGRVGWIDPAVENSEDMT